MNSFQFSVGGVELLPACRPLWQPFIESQTAKAGVMAAGVAAYIDSLQDGGLLDKTRDGGRLQVQLVATATEIVGFCIASLSGELVGEIEVIYIIDRYRGHKLGERLFQNAVDWLEASGAQEQRLVVATGNEDVFGFYAKYGFFAGYTTLFRAA